MIEVKVKIEGLDEIAKLLKKILEKENTNQTTQEEESNVKENTNSSKETFVENQKESTQRNHTITREDVRKAFIEKNTPENKSKLQKILYSFGAKKISELDERYFEDVMKDLEAL